MPKILRSTQLHQYRCFHRGRRRKRQQRESQLAERKEQNQWKIMRSQQAKRCSAVRIIIYLRSAAPNEKEIDRQKEACMQLVDQNSTIIATIKEDGISGIADISMRPGLAQALEMCETRMAEVLICHRLDRLSRDPDELLRLLDRLQRAGVNVITVTEGNIFTQPKYLVLREMYTAVAHLEGERTFEHTFQGQKRKTSRRDQGILPWKTCACLRSDRSCFA